MPDSEPSLPVSYPRLTTQMGILFGFVVILAFGVTWVMWNKQEEKKTERKQKLIEEGWGAREEAENGKARDTIDGREDGNVIRG